MNWDIIGSRISQNGLVNREICFIIILDKNKEILGQRLDLLRIRVLDKTGDRDEQRHF